MPNIGHAFSNSAPHAHYNAGENRPSDYHCLMRKNRTLKHIYMTEVHVQSWVTVSAQLPRSSYQMFLMKAEGFHRHLFCFPKVQEEDVWKANKQALLPETEWHYSVRQQEKKNTHNWWYIENITKTANKIKEECALVIFFRQRQKYPVVEKMHDSCSVSRRRWYQTVNIWFE